MAFVPSPSAVNSRIISKTAALCPSFRSWRIDGKIKYRRKAGWSSFIWRILRVWRGDIPSLGFCEPTRPGRHDVSVRK